MTTTRFRVKPETDRLAWICPDPSANPPVPLQHYLALDTRDGSLFVGWSYQSDNAVPMGVWHGIVRRYNLPTATNAEALTKAINKGEFDGLFDRICKGTEVVWNGNNHVARSTDDVVAAEEELLEELATYTLAPDTGGLWDAADWLQYIDIAAEYGITSDTTDEELEEIAERIEAEARSDGAVVYRTLETLEDARRELDDEDDN